MRLFPELRGKVNAVAFSPDGAWLAAAGSSRFVHVWDTAGWKCARKLRHRHREVTTLAFHPGNGQLAVAGDYHIRERLLQHAIELWSPASGSVEQEIFWSGLSYRIRVRFTPDGGRLYCWRLLSRRGPRFCGYWSFSQPGRPLNRVWSNFAPRDLAFSPDGSFVALAYPYGGRVMQFPEEKEAASIRLESFGSVMAIRPDGRLVATAHAQSITLFVPFRPNTPARPLAAHVGDVTALAFSPSGDLLASGGEDGVIAFWEPETGSELRRLDLGIGPVSGLCFASDGLTLAVATEGGLALLDVEGG